MKTKKTNKKKKRVINKKKIFCFISFIFLSICCLWYGSRTIYFYLDSRKKLENKDKLLSQIIIDKNYKKNNFKKINSDYYFYKNAENNYLTYSNITWRIIKVTKKNEIVLIADNAITNLAFGKNKKYNTSYITKWLNNSDNKNTGILEKNLNNKQKYLTKTKTCIDNITNMKNITCKKTNENNYLSLLSIIDYINTGTEKSFINNNNYIYLASNKNSDQVWSINSEGKLNTSDGTDIYGVKPTITIKPTVSLISGEGTATSPYIIEEKSELFGSFVKLGNDIWQVYETNNNIIKLVLNDYLKINNEPIEYSYSDDNYFHNDTTYGSLAYYLNHKYLNSLTYKNLILENKYVNSYYGKDNNYDYTTLLKTTIDTKIAIPSIGDPILNNTLEDYFIATGTSKNDDEIYIAKSNSNLDTISTSEKAYVRPCISINKDSLKTGTGTVNDPYRTE